MNTTFLHSNKLDPVKEFDVQELTHHELGTIDAWHEAYRRFCLKTHNIYGLPVNRKKLLINWKEQMHEQSRLANEAKKAKE